MTESISEVAVDFINKILEILSVGKDLSEVEVKVLQAAKSCGAQMIGLHIESLDAAIVSDKAGRRSCGYSIERRNDPRRVQSLTGEISYRRTFFSKASGGYEYLADTAFGIESRSRVSEGLSLSLVEASKDMSYGKASAYVAGGEVSRQTVMGRIRRSGAVESSVQERRCVPELHIDADEAHVKLTSGKKSDVPLISVYEGIGSKGKRTFCKNIFHISEYGKTPDDLWEQALTEIERHYDLTNTKVYLHGDGASWIQTCIDWIPNAIFVLDKYHKNKEIKKMTAGLGKESRKEYDAAIRESLSDENLEFFAEITQALCTEFPEREDKIQESAGYLKNFVKGISICANDPAANNGGCTEPHVSHVLAARLSTRPMAWSKRTLKQLAPILATNQIELLKSLPEKPELPLPLVSTAAKANRDFLKKNRKWSRGLPHPDAIGALPINGKRTGTQVLLKLFT